MNSYRVVNSLAVGLLVMVFNASAWAFSSVSRDFNALIELADIVLAGTVSASQSKWRDPVEKSFIETYVTLSELEVYKGQVQSETYELRLAGGVIPPYSMRISGSPKLNLSQRYVLFIKDNKQAIFPFVGVHDGIFIVQPQASGGAIMKTLSGDVVIGVIDNSVSKIPANSRSLAENAGMSFTAFRQLIRQRLQDASLDTDKNEKVVP